MDKIQLELIAVLRENKCNISNALESFPDLNLGDFYSFMEEPEFKAAYHEAIQIRDDFANNAFMDLIDSGDRMATIEYQKMLRQSDTQNEARRIRYETMKILISQSDSKGQCVKNYCLIFKTTKSQSDEFYKTVLTENNLISPFERKKQVDVDNENSMVERFKKGHLSEIEMYESMLLIALNDSERSEYPSERKGAMDKVIDIGKRLEDIADRKRREAETDKTKLPKLLKAFVMQTSNHGIDKLDKDMEKLKALEVKND